MAANTLALIAECDIVHAHIFPYSPREGTPAARMPQVAIEVRKARAARLREAAAARRTAWLRGLVGTTQSVLVERPGDRGHAGNFADVRFRNPFALTPDLIRGKRRAAPSSAREKSGASTTPDQVRGRTGIGAIARITVTGVDSDALVGKIA